MTFGRPDVVRKQRTQPICSEMTCNSIQIRERYPWQPKAPKGLQRRPQWTLLFGKVNLFVCSCLCIRVYGPIGVTSDTCFYDPMEPKTNFLKPYMSLPVVCFHPPLFVRVRRSNSCLCSHLGHVFLLLVLSLAPCALGPPLEFQY